MDRKERIQRRKFRAVLDGIEEFFKLSSSQMPDWAELTFLTWEMNTLLNVKHSIQDTGKVRGYYGWDHEVSFRESDQQMSILQEVEPEEFMTVEKAMDSIFDTHDYILIASLFHHLTEGRKVRSFMGKLLPGPWDMEKMMRLDELSQKRFMASLCRRFEFKTDDYLLKVWPLLYPLREDDKESAGYRYAIYPYFLGRLDFRHVPASEWSPEQRRNWEIAWQRILVPLDRAREPLTMSFTWKPKFLKQYEAAEALELSDEAKRLVIEEWNRDLQATGRQYIEVPFSEEVNNKELIRKLRGQGHILIGEEMTGNEFIPSEEGGKKFEKETLNQKEAADYLNVNPRTIRNYVSAGKLRPTVLGRYTKESLDRLKEPAADD